MIDHTGGSIPTTARTKNISEIAFPSPMEAEAYIPSEPIGAHIEYGPRYPVHGLPPILTEPQYPNFMAISPVYSEDFLLRDLKNLTRAGEGIHEHHPETRKVIYESLKHAPILLDEYLKS